MFRTKEFKSWASKSGAAPINVDYCMFGMPYRKRTTLWASPAGFLDELSRTCLGNHQHAVTLSGWSFNKESRLATSRGCSAYPSELCSEWAHVCLGMQGIAGCSARHLGAASMPAAGECWTCINLCAVSCSDVICLCCMQMCQCIISNWRENNQHWLQHKSSSCKG